MNLLNIYELDDAFYNEAELILKEIENTEFYSNEEIDCFAAYFKSTFFSVFTEEKSALTNKAKTL